MLRTMMRSSAALVLLLVCAPGPAAERPVYHFAPPRNFMNDPNGLVYFDREYHLFYQHDPHGNQWGHMSWGHAVSRDMVHWQDLPLALAEENGVMIFSGSAVADVRNTSGLCRAAPCLVAIYTSHSKDRQTQNLAYSEDRGRTWTKYQGNPVIDAGLKDFRDPKVIRESGRWVMVVALPDQRKVRFYASADLKNWTALSDFGPAGSTEGVWECPDLFPLALDGDRGKTRWVLSVNVGSGAPNGGTGGQYFVGTFKNGRFINDNPPTQVLWSDWGKDFYASQSFYGMPASRRVWLGWMSNWQYANAEPTGTYRGIFSVPRTLSLRTTPEGVRLFQEPAGELRSLRRNRFGSLDGFRGEAFELIAEIAPGGAVECGLRIRKGAGAETLIGIADGTLFIDRTRSGETGFHKDFPGRHKAPLRGGGNVRLHVFGDTNSVEVFANGGETVMSERIFPPPGADGVEFYSVPAGARLVRLEVWSLQRRRLLRGGQTDQ